MYFRWPQTQRRIQEEGSRGSCHPQNNKNQKIISKILPIYTYANTTVHISHQKKPRKNNAPEHKNKLAFYCTFIKKFLFNSTSAGTKFWSLFYCTYKSGNFPVQEISSKKNNGKFFKLL
jgi:hypothetical protein